MQFKYTILYVEDVPKSLDFYQRAFSLQLKMLHAANDYGELQTGATTLSFSSLTLIRGSGKNAAAADIELPCFEIAFETEDVAAAVDVALQAGANLLQHTELMPWGQKVAYVADLDGNLVEICSPVMA
ncbi:MAG: VOC family protein [Pseudomonadales bacterium]|nr:VOC family protein [Pseudomonadales bacterium]NRA16129.1 VOC family protein [Oceanospirillaceae bacterium]